MFADACTATDAETLAALVMDWWRRQRDRGFWRGARRAVVAVCQCVCHLLGSTSDIPPVRRESPVVAAPLRGRNPGSILLRHAIVLRGPPVHD